ncbi:glycosyltransferase [Synechococcus sp. CBW1108]|uniref:glycosyltransferase n=1 Tax=Synechococcus sp. CBW1108 TaxID=1353147 RepID=UPI0018CE9E25|nr:glycosyltransferase [Synechococcus sp. CBW1108]QPN71487.1 glycosyltransferase [Synechococcus sp. CBW1108]
MNSKTPLGAGVAAGQLQGLRVLVTAIDLEQREHRGIAVYSKGVLKALRQAGAEVWLLTQFDPSIADVRASGLPSSTAKMIFSARVLESLNSGKEVDYNAMQVFLQRIPLFKNIKKLRALLDEFVGTLFPKRRFNQSNLRAIPVQNIFDNPYLQSERLGYLQDVDGLICASDIFVHSFRLAQRRAGHVLLLDLEGFDGVITTCPLNIHIGNVRFVVQSIHDLIPLEYVQTSDHVIGFSRRLRACAHAGRLFVSESTRHKYETAILQPTSSRHHAHGVVIQSPSLTFPADACDWEARIPELSLHSEAQRRLQTLEPCRYLLFNSSVEPRKNLLFVLKAFIEAGIERHGIKLCITGKLKADRYSAKVKGLVNSHPDVLLTGYVDEATKRQLFLNALAVVSPSLVEGFGIPVLDAACLGLAVIASPSESHREIQQLHDFEQHVLLCSTLETSDWASAMRLVVGRIERQRLEASEGRPEHLRRQQQSLWLDELRQQRIRRYRALQQTIDAAFQASISRVIQAELAILAGG